MFHLQTFTVTQAQATAATLRQFVANPLRSAPAPGDYLRLIETEGDTPPSPGCFTRRSHTLWMSDTPQEQDDHEELYANAPHTGTLLIAGLGVCMSLKRILATRPHLKVLQIELSQEVIDLNAAHPENGPAMADPRVQVICQDIFTANPVDYPEVTAAWFDIWPDLSLDNMQEMLTLVKRWNPNHCLDFVGCWSLTALGNLLQA